jgi:hypothetical protein
MLDLSDPRRAELSTHTGDAGWVPTWLEELRVSPDNLKVLVPDCWRLWSDENTWSASFAATPYLVRIAVGARPEVRIE